MSIPLIYQDEVLETIIVKRTQRIHTPYNGSISYFCHLSKNLWNQAHHLVYPEYKEFEYVQSYEDLDATLNKKSYYKKDGKYCEEYDNYHKLGATAQQILKVYIKAWISYLKGIKDYWDNKKNEGDKDYTGMPREPGYKTKDGEFELIFTNQQIKFRETKSGNVMMYFPKNKGNGLKDKDGKPLKILLGNVLRNAKAQNDIDSYLLKRLIWNKFDEVRVIPAGVGYWIEIVYDEEIMNKEVLREKNKLDPNIIITIDLGVENLVAITDNVGSQPIIIKSEILKAENQWYNKRRSELISIYDRQKIGCFLKKDKNGKYIKDNIRYLVNKNGKKIQILTENRNNFVMDSEHKVSRFIIERALDIKAGRVAFTRNPLWKQNINLGKRNNQNFVNLPHKKLIDKTRYKGEEVGIDVEDHTEEYTSKCSFLATESLEHHDVYIGKRVHRGLFKCSKGIDISMYIRSKKKKIIDTINADVQGAYNLLRKVDPRFTVYSIIEGVAEHGLVPERLSISELMTKNCQQLGMSHRLIVDDINCAND